MLLLAAALPAWAAIDGITGTAFNLTAKADYISTADGNSIYNWGYANGAGTHAVPGPDHDREPGRHRHRQSDQ